MVPANMRFFVTVCSGFCGLLISTTDCDSGDSVTVLRLYAYHCYLILFWTRCSWNLPILPAVSTVITWCRVVIACGSYRAV